MEIKHSSFVMVPAKVWEDLLKDMTEIKSYIKGTTQQEGLGDYITEAEAMILLGRKSTWFWEMRKEGKLKYSKIGNRIFYKKNAITELFI